MPYLDDKEIETFKKIAEAVDNVINEYYLEEKTKNYVRKALAHWIVGESTGIISEDLPDNVSMTLIAWFDEAYEFYHEEGLR